MSLRNAHYDNLSCIVSLIEKIISEKNADLESRFLYLTKYKIISKRQTFLNRHALVAI